MKFIKIISIILGLIVILLFGCILYLICIQNSAEPKISMEIKRDKNNVVFKINDDGAMYLTHIAVYNKTNNNILWRINISDRRKFIIYGEKGLNKNTTNYPEVDPLPIYQGMKINVEVGYHYHDLVSAVSSSKFFDAIIP